MIRTIAAVAASILAAVVAPSAPADAGGVTLAAAAQLPVGDLATASAPAGAGVQFWKIDVRTADMLVLDFAYVSGPLNDTGVCLLPPSTTQATLTQTPCLHTVPDLRWANGRGEVTFVAPASGTYYVAAGIADCLRAVAPDSVKPCTSESVPALTYRIGAEILGFTAIRVTAPSNVAAHGRVRLRGTVAGAGGGTVWAAFTGPHGFPGQSAHAALVADGTFTIATAGLPRGRYRVKVEYQGDTSHRPSVRTITFPVR